MLKRIGLLSRSNEVKTCCVEEKMNFFVFSVLLVVITHRPIIILLALIKYK